MWGFFFYHNALSHRGLFQDHLACFVAGSLALGAMNGFPESHLQLAKKIGEGCQRMYQTPTGLGPEIIHFNQQPNSKDDIYIKVRSPYFFLGILSYFLGLLE